LIQAASHCACSVVALPISRTTTTRADVMNGGLCSAVVSAANAGSSVEPSEARCVVVVFTRIGRSVRRRAVGRRGCDHRVRTNDPRREQLVDEPLHFAIAKDRVGA